MSNEAPGASVSRLRLTTPSLIAVAAIVLVVLFALWQSLQAVTSGGGRHLVLYEGDGFSFQYPDGWRVITGYQHYALHGPTVIVAVGTGDFDAGCWVTSTSVTCGAPRWTVPADSVVLAYHLGGWLGPINPWPTPSLGPADRWEEVGGRSAVLSRTPTSLRWAFVGAPEFIEARFDPTIAEQASAEVQSLISSWRWDSDYTPH